MDKLTKKILITLLVLAIVSPIGIFLPQWFHAGGAWGEWSTESVKEQVGYTPEGMVKNATLWNAPVPDYSNGKDNNSSVKSAFWYIGSGFLGMLLIAVITFGLRYYLKKTNAS